MARNSSTGVVEATIDQAIRRALLDVLRSPEGQAAIRSAVATSAPATAAPATPALSASDYLSVGECARVSGKTLDTIRHHIADGRLRAAKPTGSREWSVRREELDRWMEGRTGNRSDIDLDALAREKAGLV